MTEKEKGDTPALPPFLVPKAHKVVILSAGAKVFKIHKERIVLGSVESADVRLQSEGISPLHAILEISKEDGSGTLYDLGSETGVCVNGKKIITEKIVPGDEITIGAHVLKFTLEKSDQFSPREKIKVSEGRKLFMTPGEDLKPLLLEEEHEIENIFDYRPTSKTALQVVMSWHGSILDVEHFVDQKEITLGSTRGCDFAIPSWFSEPKFPLVTQSAGEYFLKVDPQMRGVMQKKGKLQKIEELGSGQIPLLEEDFVKIHLKGIDFYLNFTPAPPRLKRRKLIERDPFLIKVIFSSMLLTAFFIIALLNAKVPQNLEAEKIPDRIATVLYQPEKFPVQIKEKSESEIAKEKQVAKSKAEKLKPTPKKIVKLELQPKANPPKVVPKEMLVGIKPDKASSTVTVKKAASKHKESEAKEGQGARAKGPEGKRGSPKAPPGKIPQVTAKRPSPQGGQGRGSGHSQVKDEGNLDVLKGASSKILDLLGNSGAQLGKGGGSQLQGFGGFTTQGEGGLALSGGGKGGGGNAASLGGLANSGRGGGKVGTGLGAAGSGSGIIGGKTRVEIRSGGPEETVIMGVIDRDAIEAAILAHRDEFILCYEKEINAENPNLAGQVVPSFVIGSSGRVTQAGVSSSTIKNSNVERCVLGVLKRIQFPIPVGAGVVQVTYPFKYRPVGK